jgi:hypothetical protein
VAERPVLSGDGAVAVGATPVGGAVPDASPLQDVLRRARRQRRHARKQRAWLLAVRQQRLIDAEMWATRRQLLQQARLGSAGGDLGFLADDFLDATDPQTLFRAIIEAAFRMGWVSSVDLQLFDTARTLRIVAAQGFAEPLLAESGALGVDPQPVHCYPLQHEGADPVGVLSLRGHRARGGHRRAEALAIGATIALARVVRT